MYAISLCCSQVSDDLDQSFGLPNIFSYWTLDSRVRLVSNKPFSRGSVLRVDNTPQDHVYVVETVDPQSLSWLVRKNLGLLITMSSDVPLSDDCDYKIQRSSGRIDILDIVKCEKNGLSSYIVLCILRSGMGRLIGEDSVYNDKFEFCMDMRSYYRELVEPMKRDNRNG